MRCLYMGSILGMLLLMAGCTKTIHKAAYPTLSDGRYDSEFPYRNCSRQLEQIMESVKKINVTAYYELYVFSPEQKITQNQVHQIDLKKEARHREYFNNSSSGTGTIISSSGAKAVLLTCAHVVDYPDTLISHFIHQGEQSPCIESVSVKLRHEVYMAERSGEGNLQVLVMDRKQDIALLGQTFNGVQPQPAGPALDYPAGESKDLEWGSFVYLLGFPKGYRMITKGIVSHRNRNHSGGFLMDALFNRGFSGGIILAIRDGVPNFELVGMAKSVSAKFDYMLVPEKERTEYDYNPHLPYHGETFVATRSNIDYGITHAISIETIREFVQDHQVEIEKTGYAIHAPCLNMPMKE